MTELSAEETRNLYLAILNPIYERLHAERTGQLPSQVAPRGEEIVLSGFLRYATREHVQEIVVAAAEAAHQSVKDYLDAIKKAVPDLCRAAGPHGTVCVRLANHSEQRHRYGTPQDEPKPTVITFSPIHTENFWDKPGGQVHVKAGDKIRIQGTKEPVAFRSFQWNADNGSEWLVVIASRGGERHIHPEKFVSKVREESARPAKKTSRRRR